MPHIREVLTTSHDRHDPMLVAALAAGDLAGTDRDQAIALTRDCADCAALQADLTALARATSAVPPPFGAISRDFRLTPGDAARLRPNAWRRLVGAVSRTPSALSRPMGVGLATLGLVGLLIGNVQLGGPTAATTEPPTTGASGASRAAPSGDRNAVRSSAEDNGRGSMVNLGPVAAPAASGRVAASGPEFGAAVPAASGASGAAVAQDSKSASAAPLTAQSQESYQAVAVPEPGRPLNILFGAAVIVGIGVLVASRLRSRRQA